MAAISYKCPNCGGDLRFDPESQQYKCEFCISQFSQGDLDKVNPLKEEVHENQTEAPENQTEAPENQAEVPNNHAEENEKQEEAVFYNCPSCGAEVITDETTAATFCYYCHNPVVLQGRLEGNYLPNRVIPFKISKKKAEETFLEYVKKKKFVPHAFFCKKQIEKLSGVYFPYWLSCQDMYGEMNASATNVRVWRVGDLEYTETKHYNVERAGNIHLEEMTRNALKKANRQLVEGVQPFPMKECKDFSMGYLSGFQAEKRDLERRDLEEEMHSEAKGYAKKLLRDTISGYATVNTKNTNIQSEQETWDYVLLPVWTVTYKGNDGKIYYYAMNGATGNVFGELPIDYKKVAMLFAAVALPIFILCLIGGYFL